MKMLCYDQPTLSFATRFIFTIIPKPMNSQKSKTKAGFWILVKFSSTELKLYEKDTNLCALFEFFYFHENSRRGR